MAVLLTLAKARGGIVENFSSGGTIPDGSPLGATFGGTVSDLSGEKVGSLTVSLNISGGYNGNLYAYLVAPNGTMVQLMNMPGVSSSTPFGNAGAGMNITLQDGATAITAGSNLSGGTYAAAGSLLNFSGSTANGTWELYFADEVNGGGSGPSVLNSWSLDIEPVPEPVNTALGIFGGSIGAVVVVRSLRKPKALKTDLAQN